MHAFVLLADSAPQSSPPWLAIILGAITVAGAFITVVLFLLKVGREFGLRIESKIDTQGKTLDELAPIVRKHHDFFVRLEDRGVFDRPGKSNGAGASGAHPALSLVKPHGDGGE